MERRVEGNGSPPFCLDVSKISKGKEVISPSPYLDILKIRMKRKRND